MSGKRITNHQIRLYMESKQQGKSQQASAARAGFGVRTARRLEKKSFEQKQLKRSWKTREDPFDRVWESILIPLLEKEPHLEARTLLEELQRLYEGQYPDSLIRTLQRRIRQWKAISGPEKEIIFRQKVPPGWQGISDFTNAEALAVTIRKKSFPHLLYHYRLSFSGWAFVQVVMGGESYTALAEGLQNALWESCGTPETHRTDSLSAAYKNFSDKTKEEFTESYRGLCEHYDIEPTRNNKGVSHENGSIESPHGHLKNRIEQALMLRESRDFDSINEYRAFIRDIITRQNKRIEKTFIEERVYLKPLPTQKTCDYIEERISVSTSSTIAVRQVIYSVPSRLIGMNMKIHLYDDRLECYVGGDHVVTLPRLRINKKRLHHIDYHHIIGTLTRKPQAFRHYIYRDALFPNFVFRQAWEILDQQLDSRQACREYVKILSEAAHPDSEQVVSDYLESCIIKKDLPKSEEVKALFKRSNIQIPQLKELLSEPGDYDVFLRRQQGGCL